MALLRKVREKFAEHFDQKEAKQYRFQSPPKRDLSRTQLQPKWWVTSDLTQNIHLIFIYCDIYHSAFILSGLNIQFFVVI